MQLTAIFTLSVITIVVGYDLWAYRRWGVDGTISGLIRRCNSKFPLFGVLLGMVIGGLLVHWFGW